MPRLSIYLLGPLQIEIDGRPTAPAHRKSAAILAYLVITGTPHSRESLAAFFWPDYDSSGSLAYLRRMLYEINHTIGEGWLDTSQNLVSMSPGSGWDCDVLRFQEIYRSWKSGELTGDEEALRAMEEAAAIYRDRFMQGFSLPDSASFDDWQTLQAENLNRQFGEILQTLAEIHRGKGEVGNAISHIRRWLDMDPYQETAYRSLMELYTAAGQRNAALRLYEKLVRKLKTDLKIQPEDETTVLYKKIKESKASVSAAEPLRDAKTQDLAEKRTAPNNLPSPPTPFVGRTEDLQEISNLLENPDTRLITLIGPGGAGKTRLCIEAARGQITSYLHGIYFVTLAPLSSPDSVPGAIAESIGFSFKREPGKEAFRIDPLEQLKDYLSGKRMLLLLDNFEHILEGAPYLSELLAASPGLKILATSRERLNLREEWALEVQGMNYPKEEQSNYLEEFSAIKLFLQCARRSSPAFTYNRDDLVSISHICRLVDGMPLGIELASAWVRMMPCSEIAREIERSMDFLESPLRGVPERHRSMRAVFNHSWELLSEAERNTLRKLSIFRGSFRRETAAQVSGAGLGLLSALVDKSLIRRVREDRYVLHEMVKQYAAEKLSEMGQLKDQTEEGYSEYYLNLLIEHGELVKGVHQIEAIQQIEAEIEEIRASWIWGLEHAPAESLVQPAFSLYLFYNYSSRLLERIEIFHRSLEMVLQRFGQEPESQSGKALVAMMKAIETGTQFYDINNEAGRQLAEESYALARSIPSGYIKAAILHMLNFGYYVQDLPSTMDVYQECLQAYQDAGDRWGIANAYSTWASLMMQREYDPDLAAHLFRQAASIYQEFGDTFGLAGTLNELAFTRYWVGEYTEAREIILEAKAILEKLDNPWWMVWLRETLGQIEVDLGNYERAIDTYMDNMPFLLEMGQRYLIALHYDCIGYVEFLRQNYVKAEDYARQALEIYRKLGNSNGTGMALNNLGDSLVSVSRFEEAEQAYKEALEIFTGSSNYWALAKTHKNLGRMYFEKGDRYLSKEHYRTGLFYGLESNRHAEVLEMLYGLAQIDAAEDRHLEAVEKLAQVTSHKAATTEVHRAAKKLQEELETKLQQTMDSERICEARTRGQEKDLGEWLSE